jgi:RNA polymerase sigma-70 factor, ECF subfamily
MLVNLETVYSDFDAGLRRFLSGRLSDAAAVDDVLQQTYLHIHRRADSLREPARLQSWVYQIARNALVDYYRRQRDSVELPETVAVPDESDDENEAARDLARSMRQMLGCLPEKYQQALLLTEFEGLSQQALAEHLGISLSGAKSRVQRGREKLKAALLDCCHVELDRLGRVLNYAPNCAACGRDDYPTNCGPAAAVLEPQGNCDPDTAVGQGTSQLGIT